MKLLSRIQANILERKLFEARESVLVAVSGGVDSVVLLRALHKLARRQHWRVEVAHFNHQLRPGEAEDDARFVEALALELGCRFHLGSGETSKCAQEKGVGLEMAARELRHLFLDATARTQGIRKIAMAHQADDQAELFFIRLLRGTVGEGLGGMDWCDPSPTGDSQIVRPLLDLTRAELREFAQEQGWAWREDATNAEPITVRNRVRHRLLPALTEEFGPGIERRIWRIMEGLRDQSSFIRESSEKAAGQALATLAPALQRQILLQQLHEQGIAPTFELVEQLRAGGTVMVRPSTWAYLNDLGMIELREIERLEFNPNQRELDLAQVETAEFDGIRFTWRFLAAGASIQAEEGMESFDADLIGSHISLRHWRPGDRFQPIGFEHHVKLQDFFTKNGVPAAEKRRRMLAATEQGEIFWIEGLRIGERFKLRPETRRILEWRWQRDAS